MQTAGLPSADAFIENAKRTIELTWKEKGKIEAMAAIHCTRDIETSEPLRQLVVVMGDFADVESKDGFAQVVRKVAKAGDAEALTFASEAYSAVYDTPDAADGVMQTGLAGRPEAREVIILTIEHKELREAVTYQCTIDRAIAGDEASPGTLGEWREMTGHFSGRMTNFLPGAGGN